MTMTIAKMVYPFKGLLTVLKKHVFGWMDGWMERSKSRFKDLFLTAIRKIKVFFSANFKLVPFFVCLGKRRR